MIFEISSALMSICFLPASSGEPSAASSTWLTGYLAAGRWLLTAARQTFFHLLQLCGDAAVVHRAADARDDATDDRGIDARIEDDGAAGHLREAVLHGLGAVGRQLDRRGDLGADDLQVGQQPLA